MNFTKAILPLAGLTLLATTSCSTCQQYQAGKNVERATALPNLVQYANPMCGTGTSPGVGAGDNKCYPAAVAPFGMNPT